MEDQLVQAGNQLVNILINQLLIPAFIILVGVVLVKIQGFVKKTTDTTNEKNNKESLNTAVSIVGNVTKQLEVLVEAAVASNMSLANELKAAAADGVLTDDEVKQLQDNAKRLVYTMLPENIIKVVLLDVLGGQEALDQMIMSFMERRLIAVKAEIAMQSRGIPVSVESIIDEPTETVEPFTL